MLEIDFELVAFDCRNSAVAELAVEHALTEREIGAAGVAEAHGGGSYFQRWLTDPPACPYPARAGARVALSRCFAGRGAHAYGALPAGTASGAGDVGEGIGAFAPLRAPEALAAG